MTNTQALKKSLLNLKSSLPIMLGVLLLVGLVNQLFSNYYTEIFNGSLFLDPLKGALAGSISFGIPITSFIVGGELLEQGVSLIAITAFILAWSTVGIAMLPLEISTLGKKFSIIRNSICFVFSVIIAILTVWTLSLIQF
jgi:hypothetical protein